MFSRKQFGAVPEQLKREKKRPGEKTGSPGALLHAKMGAMKQRKPRRNKLPRRSSPAGIAARQELRIRRFTPEIPKGGSGTNRCRKPGSCNPRKVGR